MRCPNCGARTTADASWCGRCHAALALPPAAPTDAALAPPGPHQDVVEWAIARGQPQAQDWDVAPGPAPPPSSEDAGGGHEAIAQAQPNAYALEQSVAAWEVAAASAPAAAQHTHAEYEQATAHATSLRGAIGEHTLVSFADGTPGWCCGVCSNTARLDVTWCTTCGKSLFSSEQTRPPIPEGQPNRALAWSVIPGGGQWYLGERLEGVARLVLVVLCVFAALSFPSDGAVGAMRLVLFGVAALLWGIAAFDARAVALGSAADALLGGRRLVWATAGILALLVAMVFVALAMGALSGPAPT